MMRYLKILLLSICFVGLMVMTAQAGAASVYAVGGATNVTSINTVPSVSREGLALSAVNISGGALAASNTRSVAFNVDTILQSGDTVTYTISGAVPLESTDLSYWLVEKDIGSTATLDTGDQVVSSKCSVSGSTITCTLNNDMDADGENILVLVRADTGSGTATAHGYAEGETLSLPTWRISSSTTGGAVTATVVPSRTQTTQMGSATLSSRAGAEIAFEASSQIGGILSSNPATLSTNSTDSLGKVTLLSSTSVAPNYLIKDNNSTPTFGAVTLSSLGTNATFTLTISGPMSGVKRIFWNQDDGAGYDDADTTKEKFTIDTTANAATLSLTGETVTDISAHNLFIQFDGTTTLTPRVYKITGKVDIGSYSASTTDIIGSLTYTGAVVRPAYMYLQSDDWKQFIRFSIDETATATPSATIYGKVTVDGTKTIWLNLGTVSKGTEKLIWGYDIQSAAATAGYTISGRVDIDFIVYNSSSSSPFSAAFTDPNKKYLNVMSVQKSPTGDRYVPVHYVTSAGTGEFSL